MTGGVTWAAAFARVGVVGLMIATIVVVLVRERDRGERFDRLVDDTRRELQRLKQQHDDCRTVSLRCCTP